MLARNANFTVIDFETTGSVPGYPNEPWQIGMVSVRAGRVCADTSYSSLLRIGDRPFNPYAPGRYAMLRDKLVVAPIFSELWPEMTSWLLGPGLVAHNVATERTVLANVAPLHRFGPWVDTCKLARHAYPDLTDHKLETIVSALDLSEYVRDLVPGREAHDALYDAFASAVLLEHLLAMPAWASVSVDALVQCR